VDRVAVGARQPGDTERRLAGDPRVGNALNTNLLDNLIPLERARNQADIARETRAKLVQQRRAECVAPGEYRITVIPLLVVRPHGGKQAALAEDRRAVIAHPSEYRVPLAEVVVHPRVADVEIPDPGLIAAPVPRRLPRGAAIGLRVEII